MQDLECSACVSCPSVRRSSSPALTLIPPCVYAAVLRFTGVSEISAAVDGSTYVCGNLTPFKPVRTTSKSVDLGFSFHHLCASALRFLLLLLLLSTTQYVWPLLYACTKQLLYGYAFPVLQTLCTGVHWVSLVVSKLLLGASCRLA